MNVFKPKKQKSEPVMNAPPVKTAAQTEADRVIARGARIKTLSDEAHMWRKFAAGCKPGRFLTEHYGYSSFGVEHAEPLSVLMDNDTALLWAAFAQQMADERERRLKDVLGM
jgi:hypothetical protein